MKKYDIVYFYKYTKTQELKYSLRSVEKNMPHNEVWIYGDMPDGIKPDHMIEVLQSGFTVWQRTTNMLKDICLNPDISENFWLFNDDFFILKPMTSEKPVYAGTLEERVAEIEQRHKSKSAYSRQLERVIAALKKDGFKTRNYATHTPLLVNKEKALETIERYPTIPMFRALYGNMHDIKGRNIKRDVKLIGAHDIPKEDQQFVSTNDTSFNKECGKYIRRMFAKPSRFEVKADG